MTIFDSSNLTYKEFLNQLRRLLRKIKRFLTTQLTLEFDKFKTASMKAAISERNMNFYEQKGKFISSSLNREKRFIVLNRVLVVDTPNCPKLLVAPEEIKDAAIAHFQNVVGPSVSPFDSLSSLPSRWQKRYSPLEQFHESLYDPVMLPITLSELREVISLSPAHKAPGPSSIPYEWFKLLSDASLQFLCDLMNRCLDLSDIPEDWRCASITPIPKPHEFDALLKNTRPITLLETAQKLLVKIINNRLSNILSTHRVLQGNNFAGLSGSSVNTPINVLDGIIKSHRLSHSSQELWILSQDISKAFDSIDLRMLYLAFDRLRFPKNLSNFIISLFTNRKNCIFTPYGLTSPYNVLIGIDQGKVISPLLWTIYFDLLLTELSHSAISPYLWSSNMPKDIYHVVIMNMRILSFRLRSSPIWTIPRLYRLPNFLKYELVCSVSRQDLITFSLSSEFSHLMDAMDLQLTPMKLLSSFRFLVRFKKLAPKQLAYLHSAVILPKIHFRSQVTYIPEGTLTQITLQQALKWPLSLDKIFEFSKWNSSQRSIHHNWIFQTLRILSESGLKLTLPVGLCLDLMPSHSIPLVTLSSELANSEKVTWLFSKLWCLSQLVDPFHQFIYTWMDLKRMNLVSKTGKTPSWFIRLTNIPNLPKLLPDVTMPIQYPSSLMMLQTLPLLLLMNNLISKPVIGIIRLLD
ncbi:unnamed protein product [Rhizophagus irregularis]|nr:unnamed protein product [Rhizophagus irregularis]